MSRHFLIERTYFYPKSYLFWDENQWSDYLMIRVFTNRVKIRGDILNPFGFFRNQGTFCLLLGFFFFSLSGTKHLSILNIQSSVLMLKRIRAALRFAVEILSFFQCLNYSSHNPLSMIMLTGATRR